MALPASPTPLQRKSDTSATSLAKAELARASSPMMTRCRMVKEKTMAAARKYIFTQK